MSVKIDQAFSKAFGEGAFGLPVAHENAPFTEKTDTEYAAITLFQNENLPHDLAHTDSTTGAFQVILRYPLNTGSFPAKIKLDEIFTYFTIGRRFEFSGQGLEIRSTHRFSNREESGMYQVTGRINYRAYLPR